MAIEWSQDLETSVPEIDAQHRELFRHVNELLDACKVGRGKEEVAKILDFLQAYVKVHFSTEETIMARRAYPDAERHRMQHGEFLAELDKLAERFAAEGATMNMLTQTNHAVVYWLATHIRNTDKQLATFLKSNA